MEEETVAAMGVAAEMVVVTTSLLKTNSKVSTPGLVEIKKALPVHGRVYILIYKKFTFISHFCYKTTLKFVYKNKETIMNTITKRSTVLFTALVFLLSACKANITRNPDGSFDVETTIGQQELQEAVTAAIADPLVKEVTVSLQSGYMLVSGVRERLNDPIKTDTLSFRLDLGVSNGQLTTSISNAQLDGAPIEQNRIDHWNQSLANRIALLGQKNPNSILKSVSVTPTGVTMLWNVTKQ
jgi:hypothetical protein